MPRYALLLLLLLAACGGGGNQSPGPQPLPLRDTTPPVITLTGDNPQVITTGSSYIELGATATDNLVGNLTSSIVVDAGAVDTSVAGSYAVTYNVSDAAGNAAATVTRTVNVEDPPPPVEPQVSVSGDIKKIVFGWQSVDGAEFYRLLENADGHSGFSQVGDHIAAGTLTANREIAVHLFDFVNAQYLVEACSVWGCSSSDVVTASSVMLDTIGYFKASNSDAQDYFGSNVTNTYIGLNMALSDDGKTLAVGAPGEDSAATGIGGNQISNNAEDSGAVYLYRLDDTRWRQEAYLKASNTNAGDLFGFSVALSTDGNVLVVGAPNEDSEASGINGDEVNNSAIDAGAAYVFDFDGTTWRQQHYIKPTITELFDGIDDNFFGFSVALDSAGDLLAIGAPSESSSGRGVNPCPCDSWDQSSGAVYVLRRGGSGWAHDAFIKGIGGEDTGFGSAVELSGDATTLVVGAPGAQFEPENAFVFRHNGLEWETEAEIIGSNTDDYTDFRDNFGHSVAVNFDGTTLAVSAPGEASASTEINGDQSDNSRNGVGAVYLFRFDSGTWTQQAYLKPSTISGGPHGQWIPFSEPLFGIDISLDVTGNLLAVGAIGQNSADVGVDADKNDHTVSNAGAVFLFESDGISWWESAFVKAPNTGEFDRFGGSVGLSEDGSTMAVGAYGEDSAGVGIDADQNDDSAEDSGAVYVY